MASVRTLSIRFEADLISDAARDMEMIWRALPKCHGEKYRDFERRFEESCRIASFDPGIERLDDAWFIVTPPAAFQSMIAEARALGII
ncbi:hypothetical protein [Pseudorhodoplanes sp.]|uniref:hypothetical protein n=1 Tax=Pseudorhodoplanes sp. TaxID=1934341 RepID=UPI002BA71EB4|nr:hypothetical protein [Pseudorhodoplanes sp.]HWV44115.1 hypothetical protein [Pseudorhodoplanes sp.]